MSKELHQAMKKVLIPKREISAIQFSVMAYRSIIARCTVASQVTDMSMGLTGISKGAFPSGNVVKCFVLFAVSVDKVFYALFSKIWCQLSVGLSPDLFLFAQTYKKSCGRPWTGVLMIGILPI